MRLVRLRIERSGERLWCFEDFHHLTLFGGSTGFLPFDAKGTHRAAESGYLLPKPKNRPRQKQTQPGGDA